jgi:choline dehydrogenase
MYADASGDHPDVQLFFGGYLANCARTGTVGEPEDTKNPINKRSISISPVVLHPKSRGYIALNSSNPLDPPLMYGNYFSDPADMATLLDAINITLKLGNTKVLRERFGFELDKAPIPSCIQKYTFGSQGYWECYARTATGPENHQVGSCRMGPSSDPMAVVDPELRVHGVKNLRIMDASIMPMVVSGNTNAPVIMIAEKGSDMIKKLWLPNDISDRFGSENGKQNVSITSGFFGNNPSHSGGYNHGGYPNWGGFGSNNWNGGYGSSQGHSNSGYGGNQGYASGRVHHPNQGFIGAGTHGSYQRPTDNQRQGGYGNEAHGNAAQYDNSVHADPRYQHMGTYNSGTGRYNFVPYKTGQSDDGQYRSSDRCRHLSGGTYHKNDCNNNSNGGNAFDFKRNSTPTPLARTVNILNGHQQNYWIPNKQATKQGR